MRGRKLDRFLLPKRTYGAALPGVQEILLLRQHLRIVLGVRWQSNDLAHCIFFDPVDINCIRHLRVAPAKEEQKSKRPAKASRAAKDGAEWLFGEKQK